MASPVVEGTPTESNATADDASPFTVSRPAAVSGRTVIIVIAVDGNPTLTWPSGYTEFVNIDRAGTFVIAAAWHKDDGTEGGTIDITSSASEKWAAIAYSISGADDPNTRAPEATAVDGGAGTSANPDPPAITPTGGAKDYLFIACAATDGESADDDTYYNTPPTNYIPSPPRQKTTAITGAATTNATLATSERALNASTENPGTYATDAARTWLGATIAVHPLPPEAPELLAGAQMISVP